MGETGAAGLSAAEARTDLRVDGMTCGACAARVERTLNKIDGVTATVNYATERATITHPAEVDPARLVEAVERAGYTAVPPAAELVVPDPEDTEADADGRRPHLVTLRERLAVCAVLATPVIVMSMVPATQFSLWQWAALALTVPVATWGAWPFHRAAVAAARQASATMDTLVSLGTLAALVWSLYALAYGSAGRPGHVHAFTLALEPVDAAGQIYLEVAAGITTFVLAGRFLEAKARSRAGDALRGLLGYAAATATVLRDGSEVTVTADQLVVGDRLLVRAGDKIAADGAVELGTAALDVRVVTGESAPMDVAEGDPVIGGCIVVSGRLVVAVARVGADTQLAQMAALVEEAQTGKASVQRLADRISAVFVPGVLLLAAATFGFWIGASAGAGAAFGAAAAVLIVACPCALGLATPTALLVGTGRAAQLGILIAGPAVLESTRRVDTVLLDKTGTVTTGQIAVTDVSHDRPDPSRMFAQVAALAATSAHPVSVAVARYCAPRVTAAASRDVTGSDDVTIDDVTDSDDVIGLETIEGLGLRGIVDGHDVMLGNSRLVREHAIALPPALGRAVHDADTRGRSTAVWTCDGHAQAVFVVSDTVRPSSAQAVAQLRRLGLEPILVTGDRRATADAVAAEVGIDRVIADALPTDKVAVVAGLQAQGRRVAMVGDGINDAAALAHADIGIAMGTGSDIAIAAADLTLIRADLTAAVHAIELSRRTLTAITGNLRWAFAYNLAALPVAAAGLLHPCSRARRWPPPHCSSSPTACACGAGPPPTSTSTQFLTERTSTDASYRHVLRKLQLRVPRALPRRLRCARAPRRHHRRLRPTHPDEHRPARRPRRGRPPRGARRRAHHRGLTRRPRPTGRRGRPVGEQSPQTSVFRMQMARCASSTACLVACAAPASASAAALALSPACSSSITESRAALSVSRFRPDLSALLSNSRTTATSTTDAPESASAARNASAVLAFTSSSLLPTSIMTCPPRAVPTEDDRSENRAVAEVPPPPQGHGANCSARLTGLASAGRTLSVNCSAAIWPLFGAVSYGPKAVRNRSRKASIRQTGACGTGLEAVLPAPAGDPVQNGPIAGDDRDRHVRGWRRRR